MFLLLDQIQDMMNKHLAYFEDKFKAELEKREEILNDKMLKTSALKRSL